MNVCLALLIYDMIKYDKGKYLKLYVCYLEPDSMPYAINRTITARELAQDFLTFHQIMHSSEYGRYYQHAKLVGDDTSHCTNKKYLVP